MMAGRVIRVVDLSEWTGDVPLEAVRCMVRDQNIEGVILQAWGGGNIPGRRNEFFHEAARAFRDAGVTRIDPYIWPPSDWRAAIEWISASRELMSGALYLDVEAGAGVNDEIVNGVRAAGWEPRIYASPNSWRTIMGNTARYAWLKLWIARYLLRFQRPDGFYRPGFDVDFPDHAFGVTGTLPIGGWTTDDLVGWQTTGTVPNFCNESIDSNVFFEDAFSREEEEPHMPTEEYDEIMERITAQNSVIVDLKRVVHAQGEQLDELETRIDGVRRGAAAGLVKLDERLVPVERQTHVHGIGGPDDWERALDVHAEDPDAHHA